MSEERKTQKEIRSAEVVQRAQNLLNDLENCLYVNWTDTPFMGDRPYATWDTEKALKLILEALQ